MSFTFRVVHTLDGVGALELSACMGSCRHWQPEVVLRVLWPKLHSQGSGSVCFLPVEGTVAGQREELVVGLTSAEQRVLRLKACPLLPCEVVT